MTTGRRMVVGTMEICSWCNRYAPLTDVESQSQPNNEDFTTCNNMKMEEICVWASGGAGDGGVSMSKFLSENKTATWCISI